MSPPSMNSAEIIAVIKKKEEEIERLRQDLKRAQRTEGMQLYINKYGFAVNSCCLGFYDPTPGPFQCKHEVEFKHCTMKIMDRDSIRL